MHRVDAPGNIAGQFSDGNPAIGQQATQVRAAWLNDLQENVCAVIEEADIELEKGESGQLLAAIQAIIETAADDINGQVTSGSNANGYWVKRPDGNGGFIIEQWGTVTLPASGTVTATAAITFPVEFTVAGSIHIDGAGNRGPNNTWGALTITFDNPTTAGTTARGDTTGGGAQPFSQTVTLRWRAIGK